jgi:hypothetical protein
MMPFIITRNAFRFPHCIMNIYIQIYGLHDTIDLTIKERHKFENFMIKTTRASFAVDVGGDRSVP